MNYCILHSQKGKGSGGPLGSHIDREPGKEHTYKRAIPELIQQNRHFKCPKDRDQMPMHLAIKDRINEGYHGKRKLRGDAVKYVDHILSASPNAMLRMVKDPDKFESWIEENRKFIEDEFGAENIVRFSLHMDEKTPHIHAVVVPLQKDGALSWYRDSRKDFKKGIDMLHDRQSRYAERMEQFGLERGKEYTGVKHSTTSEYLKEVEDISERDNTHLLEPVKGLFSVDKAKTIEKHEETIKALKIALDLSKNQEDTIQFKWKMKEEKRKAKEIKDKAHIEYIKNLPRNRQKMKNERTR